VLWELVLFVLKAMAVVWALKVVAFLIVALLYPRLSAARGEGPRSQG
jgi:hypothetical protein